MHFEASNCLYANNWFRITLDKLPSIAFEIPYGWDIARIKKLHVELPIKDSLRMNRHIDWASLFAAFPSLRTLRIQPTFHKRYYEWAVEELHEWRSTHYVHKAFFRELMFAVPVWVDIRIGFLQAVNAGLTASGNIPIDASVLRDMYLELGRRAH